MKLRLIIATMAALAGVLVLSSSTLASVKQASDGGPSCTAAGYHFNNASGKCVQNAPAPTCTDPLKVYSGKAKACRPCPKGTQKDNASGKCKLAPTTPTASVPPATTTTTTIPGCKSLANGTVVCNQQATTTRSESDRKVETLSVNTGGVLQLRWAFTGGWQPAAKDKPFCHWVTGGVNSYYDNTGKLIKIPWAGKRAYICPSATSPTGWRKAGGPPNWENCGNIFWPPAVKVKPTGVYYGKYVVVQNFSYNVKLSLTIHLHATVNANAQCKLGDNVNGSSANGSATGIDDESITVFATGSGSSMAEAIGKAHSMALTSKEVNDLYATVTATANLKMTASASATCSYTPPAPQTCQDHAATNYGGSLPCTYPPQTCQDHAATNYGGSLPCTYPPPAYAKIIGMTDLNDIPAGQSSTNYYVLTNFSIPGTITIDPGNSRVMTCGGSAWTAGLLTVNIAAGNNVSTCLVFQAPTDASATTNTIKVTTSAPGTQPDSASDVFAITHSAGNRPPGTN